MADRRIFWGMMTPPEVRRASLWALAGGAVAFLVAPAVQPYGRLLASFMVFLGTSVSMWCLVRIGIGAPGWRIGLPGEFDERETAERHRALATSYVIVSLVFGGVIVLAGILDRNGFDLSALADAPPGTGVLAIFGLQALPGVILAWRSKRIEFPIDDED